MIKNYLKIVWRSLLNDKGFSLVNIFGLVVGLVSFIFISLYITDELSYDEFHVKDQKVYRLWTVLDVEGQGERSSSMAFPVGPNLINSHPDIFKNQARFFNLQKPYLSLQTQEESYNEPHVFFTDSTVFNVLNLSLVHGNEEDALIGPGKIVISETLSRKYFGVENSIGDIYFCL